jgi:hypothetical protein
MEIVCSRPVATASTCKQHGNGPLTAEYDIDELTYRSAAECLMLLRNGEGSSVELVDACIARIEALNPVLHADVAKDYAERACRAHSNPRPHLGDKTTIRFAELLAEVGGGFREPPAL